MSPNEEKTERKERTETVKELQRKIKLNKQAIVKFKKSLSEAEKKSKQLDVKLARQKKAEDAKKAKAKTKINGKKARAKKAA